MAERGKLLAVCGCGRVALEAVGAPIVSAACYCTSCQVAGRQFEETPGAPRVLDPDGGTGYVLYRKDRVVCLRGAEHLEEHRLKPRSSTRRVLAACCSTPIFLDFTNGHWLTLYRDRLPVGAAPLEMRVMTENRPPEVELPGDVPNYPRHSGGFMWRLLAAWAAMGFRRPPAPA